MAKTQDKKRKQELGIFYTPSEVVHFIFEFLNLWKENQPNRWKTKEGKPKYPSVIDPAVGEGGFLKVAIEKNFTKPDWIFGLDIDENAVKKWKEINLLKEFGGIDKDLEAHFFHQNGLEKIKWGQHKDKYKYKLKQVDINNQQFDTVVGNPPYGGVGLGETELTDDLIIQLAKFEILPKITKDSLSVANTQTDLFGSDKSFSLKSDAKQRIKSFPIEILFLERFIQLSKPGGWIAIIIPDGILTNSNSHYVREFLSDRTKVEAIISLPRETFKKVGTNAKTSILFLRKLKEKEKLEQNYKVFLASVEKINQDSFDLIVKSYQKLYNLGGNRMNKSDLVQVTKNQNNKEVVMVRTDKKLGEMLDAKPYSRLNVDFWHPQFDQIYEDLTHFSGKVVALKTLLENQEVISCDHVRASRKEQIGSFKTAYFTVDFIMPNGYDISSLVFASDNSYERLQRSSLKLGDIAIAGSGQGSVGKSFVYRYRYDKAIVGDLFIIRTTKSISPYYLQVYLQTKYGKLQIQRFESGVSGQTHINKQEIEEFLIPLVKDKVQKQIELLYQQVAVLFDEAIENKKNNHTVAYKEKLEKSTNLLNNLISKTEEVINGKRDDIN